MKILVVNDYANRGAGGASMVALAQAEAMATRGHDVTFFSATAGPRSTVNGVRFVDCDQHDMLGHPNRFVAAGQGIWNFKVQRHLAQLIEQLGSSNLVCHLHSWSKALSSSVIPTIREYRVPIVCTLHDSFVACPNGGFYDYRRGEPCTLKPMSMSCISRNCDSRQYGHKLWRVGRQWVQSRIGHLPGGVDRLLAVSEFSQRLLAPHVPAGIPFIVVPTPISIPRSEPLPVSARSDAVFVGRLSPEKGVTLYAHACRAARIAPLVLGDGALAEEMRTICADARISGWLDSTSLRERLATARVMVLPTRAYEAQPLSVLESAALGVPFIVSAHCAAADYVRESQGGLLLDSDDPAELAALMRRLLDDDALATRLGDNAYSWFWSSLFSKIDALDDLLEQQYRAVLLPVAATPS